MKSREEYLESIYKKRDIKLASRKKTISVLTSIACLVICFAAVFAFVPKKFGKKISTAETTHDKFIYTSVETTTSADSYTFPVIYQNSEIIKNENDTVSTYKPTDKSTVEAGEEETITEIAAEASDETTRNKYFGYIGEPFDPDKILSGSPAISPENPPEDFVNEVTEPYYEDTDSAVDEEKTVARTSAPKTKSPEEAIEKAKKFLNEEDSSEIIDEKTQVTVTRTSGGETKYNVYLYTNKKLFNIELDSVTLRVIGCTEKNLITGNKTHISPPWFPETTAALPEYKPQ